jgi:hypothetical protein
MRGLSDALVICGADIAHGILYFPCSRNDARNVA